MNQCRQIDTNQCIPIEISKNNQSDHINKKIESHRRRRTIRNLNFIKAKNNEINLKLSIACIDPEVKGISNLK